MSTNQIDPKELESELQGFYGSEDFHRSSAFTRAIFHTDGVQYLAEKAGAYWLIDAIVSHQMKPSIAREKFQVWRLVKKPDESKATLICTDGGKDDLPGEKVIVTQKIPYTDFPLEKITLYLENGSLDGEHIHKILMLPSER